MKLLIISAILALCAAGLTFAQVEEDTLPVGGVWERSSDGVDSFEEYRPVGDFRLWRFFSKQTTFGQLSSGIRGRTEVDGDDAYRLEHSLRIDYTQLGGEQVTVVRGESFVSDEGKFLGHRLELGDDSTTEQFELARNDDRLEGFYTRGGAEQTVDVPYDGESFFWDVQLVDQLEAYLAFQDLEIGTIIEDSIYLPQSMMMANLRGQAIYFMWQEIYRGKIDSVYIIRLWEPSDYQLYFTPDKKLVRVDMLNQGIRVYQDLVQRTAVQDAPEPATPTVTSPSLSVRAVLFKLPHYVAFLVITAIGLAMVAMSGFRFRSSYLYLGVGGLFFLLMPLVINRVMISLSEVWLAPALEGGGSLYVLGFVPPMILAVIHVALLWAGTSLLNQRTEMRPYRMAAVGAFMGAGFALVEAVYLAGLRTTILFDWPLAERAALLILYVMAGALIGRSLAEKGGRISWLPIVPVVFIAICRFLPLLVPAGAVDVEAMHFILIIWVLIFAGFTIGLLKRPIAQEFDVEEAETEESD